MILHLLEDDKNIVNRTISMYEKIAPGNNEYWIEDQGEHVLAFLKEHESAKRLKFDGLIDKINLSKYNAIIFHALNLPKILFLNQLLKPSSLKLIWILWGADMYNHIHLKGYKLLNYEPSIFNIKERMLFYGGLKKSIPLQIKNIIKKNTSILSNFERAITKLDFVCAYDEDFALLKKYFPSVSAKCLFYNYYPIESTLGDKLVNRQVSGNNILIGNSSAQTNNHYSAFRIINNHNLSSKVIVPLSYGESSYRKFIIDKGNKMFGNNFVPLVNFLPIDEYYELLLSCGIVIMPQLRQQAVGNIVIALYLGAKVFLYEENPLYSFFTKIGITIFSIDKIINVSEEFDLLDQHTIGKNREIVEKHFSTETTENYVNILFQEINQR
jgi:hypothetical protein